MVIPLPDGSMVLASIFFKSLDPMTHGNIPSGKTNQLMIPNARINVPRCGFMVVIFV